MLNESMLNGFVSVGYIYSGFFLDYSFLFIYMLESINNIINGNLMNSVSFMNSVL